jgi:uncharacterized protein with von Willebrand factor type A (vWA) domain
MAHDLTPQDVALVVQLLRQAALPVAGSGAVQADRVPATV